MKYLIAGCAAAAALMALGGGAQATILAPGTSIPATLSTQTFGNTPIASTSGTISAGTFSGTFREGVFTDTVTGDLDFVFSFTNSGPSAVEHVSMSDFTGFITDVGYALVSGGSAPNTESRSTTGALSFDFTTSPDLAAGATTDALIVKTNATAYGAGFFSAQDGSAGSAQDLAPVAVSAAPEPGAWALMLGGVGLLGLMLRGRLTRRRDDELSTFTAV